MAGCLSGTTAPHAAGCNTSGRPQPGMLRALVGRLPRRPEDLAALRRRDVAAYSVFLNHPHHHNPFDFRTGAPEDLQEKLGGAVHELPHPSPGDEKGQEAAKAAALRLLGMRPHSRRELKKRLLDKGFAPEDARKALDRLQAVGLQSDAEFAEVFARSKWRQSKWSPAKISSELHRCGVEAALAELAVESVFGSGALDVPQHIERMGDEPELGEHLEPRPEGALLEVVRRLGGTLRGLSPEARKRRLVGWLQRRGHTWATIKHLLAQLDREAAVRHCHDGCTMDDGD